MEGPRIDVRDPNTGGGPLRFSLLTIFIVMTALAIFLAGLFGLPEWLVPLTAVFFALSAPMVLTIVLIYGRGDSRTFCIGALFPAGVLLFSLVPAFSRFHVFSTGPFDPGDTDVRMYIVIFILVSCIVMLVFGLLAVGVRWLLEAPGRRRQRPPATPTEQPDDG